ncbi:pullulanase X25 domain-containing protein [Croceimicrobium hydrocarbonivorans]|uniref:T9SS type A sorting domain-containing protein n=1 Tax=Croceimicrobium hydrocarbonivorans TaxID=2761580 RepID=A0A7H0VCW3_9FLAO|nr:T9SS type A sorting domain-containing protein [Croceimicrobium hydrocarbonivorans]QNR23561.1 T9SS type A sorting domain-containing protein [Croceimicrobium hydrocarbonivorans]
MKKSILLIGLCCLLFQVQAQNRNVEFRLDLSGFSPNAAGIHIAGNFQLAAGFPSNWDPSSTALSSQGNNVYSVSVNIPDGNYEYKFINGNSWGSDEIIPGACSVNGNRGLNLSSDTLIEICYTLCVCAPDSFNLSFHVDMNKEAAFSPGVDSVDIAGPFNAWNGNYDSNYNLSDPDGDGVYSGTFRLEEGLLEYKARYHNAGGTQWETGNNKQINFDRDSVLAQRCFNADTFGACPIPPDTFNVSIQIDMNADTTFNPTTDQVDIAGAFSNWDPAYNAAYQLSDPDNDLVYTAQFAFAEQLLEYKARFHSNGITNWEQGGNKTINFNRDTIVPVRCFSSDTLGNCPTQIDSFYVTLQVDLSNEKDFNPALDSIDLAAAFTNWDPNYNTTYALTDANTDSIWEITLYLPDSTLDYKIRFHNANGVNWEPGLDKSVTFWSDTTIAVRCFGSDTLGLCPFIPDTFNVTVQVDLSAEAGFDPTSDQVDIAGNFSNWDPNYNANYALTDPDNDLVYTAQFAFPEPLLEYKARFHSNGITNWEQGANKIVNFNGDTVVPVRCFSSDTLGYCPAQIDSFYVTLQVDLSNEKDFNPLLDSIDLAASFTNWNPNYNAAYALSDANTDSIWEITLYLPDSTLDYKIRFHNANGVNWEPGLDKSVTFWSDTTIAVRCFGSDTLGLCPFIPDTFNVTIQVDLSAEAGFDPTSDLVDIAGAFSNWDPAYNAAYQLSDPDNDLIYTAQFAFAEPNLEYKARFHSSGITNWEQGANKIVNFNGDTVVPVRCFSSDTLGNCPAQIDSFYVTLQVDLSNEKDFNPLLDSIDLAASFTNWNPNYNAAYALSDANTDSIWEITLYLPDSTLDYKIRFHNANGVNWEPGLDKSVTFWSDTTIAVRCFGSDTLGFCPNIPDTFNVTVQVDLSAEAGFDPTTDQVDIAGDFSNWDPAYNAAYQLSDPDNDLIYTAQFAFAEPILEYKARFHAGGITNWEQGGNKTVNFSGDTVVPVRCFGSDTLGNCPAQIDSFYVTLQVDLSNEKDFNPLLDSIDLAASFTNWNPNYNVAYALTDANTDSIWEITLYLPDSTLDYKIRFHNANGVNWEPGLDKSVTFWSDTTIDVRCFGSDTLGLCPNIPDTFNVTLQVDLSAEAGFDPSTDQVDIAGAFSNWDPAYNAAYQLSDPDNDLIYTAQFAFPEPLLEYKARFHSSGITNWEQGGNKTVNFNGDTVVPVRCFSSDTLGNCHAQIDSFYVTLQVDLSNEKDFNPALDSIDLAAAFTNWDPNYNTTYALTDANTDSIWEITLYLPDSTLDYKIRFHNANGVNWEPGLDKSVTFWSDTTIAVRCFGSDTLGLCPNIPDTFNVTIQVDLSAEAGFDPTSDQVDIAGAFSNWDPNYNANYALTDPDNDLIYTAQFAFAEPILEYKARFHSGGTTNWEQGGNKTVNFSGDTVVPLRCFSSDTLGNCPAQIDSFYVTLQVDLSNEKDFNPALDSIDLAASFSNWDPNYNAAYALTDANTDSIWEITLYLPDSTLDYKIRYHNAQGVNWEPGLDKSVTFWSDTTIDVRCFGSDTLGLCPNLPDTFNVTLNVDLSNEASFNPAVDFVDIAGFFSNWNGAYDPNYQLSDPDGDLIYTGQFAFAEPLLEYKARYHSSGSTNWENGANKIVNFNKDTVVGVRCFGNDFLGACNPVIDTFFVSLQVDMNYVTGFNPLTDSIDIAGAFSNWDPNLNLTYLMSDPDGDLVYDYTIYAPEPLLEYKARFHSSNGTNWENGANKLVNFSSDTLIPVRCFNSDTAGACVAPPPSPGIRFELSNLILAEASGTTPIALILSPSNASADTALILISKGNGASNSDFSTLPLATNDSLYLPIPANSDTLYFDLQIVDDLLVENTEQISFQLQSSSQGLLQIGSPANLLISILDNDVPSIPNYSIADISSQQANGLADSISVYCRLSGVLNSVDFKGGSGYDFHIADGSNALHISSPLDLNGYSNPSLGDSVVFIGQIAQSNGLLTLMADSLKWISANKPLPNPILVNAYRDSEESQIIKIGPLHFVNPANWPASGNSASLLMTNGPDTLSLHIDADTDIDGQNAITGNFEVTGVLSQNDPSLPYTEGYFIRPRFYSDFTPINSVAICISEIMPNSGLAWPIQGDWFEIYNYGNIPISLNGFSWDNSSGQSGAHSINGNWSLAPGERAILADVQAPFAATWIFDWKQNGNNLPLLIRDRDFNGFASLNAQGDAIHLFDSQGHLAAYSAYQGSDVLRGYSLEFDTLGSFSSRAVNGLRGAYVSLGGDVASPGNLSPIGLDENAYSPFEIYPNPAQDFLKIEANNFMQAQVQLIDQAGRPVGKWTLNGQSLELNTSQLAAGIYLLSIESDGYNYNYRISLKP